ncbi:MAG: hypothetical protein H6850_01010 [Alphaproteobacteria bacterium]|nr:MAG: hypothetical protein H6850_01010 [Alphaproteobacteria bacterium]
MLFLFASTTAAAPSAANEEMATIFEADEKEVIVTYKGGVVTRKDVIDQLKGSGINFNKPQSKKMLKELENRIGLSIAFQRYITNVMPEHKMNEQDRAQLNLLKGQFIAKKFVENKSKSGVTDQDIRDLYKELRAKAKDEKTYDLSICVVADKAKANEIVKTVSSKSLKDQRGAFTKAVSDHSLFDPNKNNAGKMPAFTKDMLQKVFGEKYTNDITSYAKNSFIPKVFEVKGSYFIFFLDNIKKVIDSMPEVSDVRIDEIKPTLLDQVAAKNRVSVIRDIAKDGKIQVKGMDTMPDDYLQLAVAP